MRGVLLLAGTVVCEVLGTVSLAGSVLAGSVLAGSVLAGWGMVGVLAGYGLAVLLFSRALDHGLPLGIAYGTVTGCGLVAATVLGAAVLGEPLAPLRVAGLALVLGGALLLQRRVRA